MRKIAIVGNGAIGTLTALIVKEAYPDSEVTIYGNQNRTFAASTAAGAMANVYAEVESSNDFMESVQRRYLEMGKLGSREWLSFLDKSNGMSCRSAEDTFVYLRHQSSEFEVKNFEAMREISMNDGIGKDLTGNEIENVFPIEAHKSIRTAIKLHGEFSMATDSLFNHLDQLVQESLIRKVPANVLLIDEESNKIVLENQASHNFERLIVCAGVQTRNLFSNKSSILPMFQGVGVALLVNNIKSIEFQKLSRGVFRSVNRGGAQCGIHTVPRIDGNLYIGAGNYVSKVEAPAIRMDSVRYLLDTVDKDLVGRSNVYDFSGNIVVGLRPRSLDGFPMVGPLSYSSKIYVITATNRAGLTWAPFLAKEAVSWLKGLSKSDLIIGWEPDRAPISFGTRENALSYFVRSRIANALEHSLFSSDQIAQKSEEFHKVASGLEEQVRIKLHLDTNVVLHPDNWGAIIDS